MAKLRTLRVLELYSGIGGMHFALEESGLPYQVIEAVDINPAACQVYRYNFPGTKLTEGLIEGAVTLDTLEKMAVDMWLMSPPCQPFTRMGKQRDVEDKRTNSFLYLLTLLMRLTTPPQYILVENVKGFETSDARHELVETLDQCQYIYQEFMLTPLQFGIPNSRLRYFLLAKRRPGVFSFERKSDVLWDIPNCCTHFQVHRDMPVNDSINSVYTTGEAKCLNGSGHLLEETCMTKGDNQGDDVVKEEKCDLVHVADSADMNVECVSQPLRQQHDVDHAPIPGCQIVGKYLENKTADYFSTYLLSDKDLKRFVIMDIVPPSAKKTSCFARRYGNFIEGGGSVVLTTTVPKVVKEASDLKRHLEERKHNSGEEWSEAVMGVLRELQLRWFTPREMANLLCFPAHFRFPEGVTRKQMYKCLGNSLNVHVVSVLIRLLVMGDSVG